MKELVYTSARSGLKLGSNGFCTVAMSDGLAVASVEFLERLSNVYRPVYMPYDSRATENPVAVSLVRVRLSGQSLTILSRNAASGVDHTGRTNNLAHHLVFESATECAASNPASVAASRQSFFEQWDQPPGRLPARQASVASGPSGTCRLWSELTGDSGWAATVASAWTARDSQPLYVIYPARTDILGLFAEAISLLPSERRWEATFTTYFTSLPPEATCTVRAVLAGTPQEIEARRSDHVDLMDLVGPAPDGILADRARGRQSNSKPEFVPVAARGRPVHSNEPDVPKASPVLKGASDNAIAIDEVPPEVNRFALHRSASSQATQKSGSGMWARILAVVFATVALLSLGVGAIVAKSQSDARIAAEQQRDDAGNRAETAERLKITAELNTANAEGELRRIRADVDSKTAELESITQKMKTNASEAGIAGFLARAVRIAREAAREAEMSRLRADVSRLTNDLARVKKGDGNSNSIDSFDTWLSRAADLPLGVRVFEFLRIDSAAERKKRSHPVDGWIELERKTITETMGDKKTERLVWRVKDPNHILVQNKTFNIIGRYPSSTGQSDVATGVLAEGGEIKKLSIPLHYHSDPLFKEALQNGWYYFIDTKDLPDPPSNDKKWMFIVAEGKPASTTYLLRYRESN